MSYALMQTVVDLPGIPLAEKAVLVVLARHANDDGGNRKCPSVATIAAKAGMSDKGARNSLRGLERRGLVRAMGNKAGGRRQTTQYVIVLAGAETRNDVPPNGHDEPRETRNDVPPNRETRNDVQKNPEPRSAEEVIEERISDASASEGGALPPDPPPQTSARGTRWKAGEEVPADLVNWGLDEVRKAGIVGVDVWHEAEQFADYWAGKSGAKGLKLDWPATWRVWIRREIKKAREHGQQQQRQQRGSAKPEQILRGLVGGLGDLDTGPDGRGGGYRAAAGGSW